MLLFVQHNILPRGDHRSEPSYIDLWLVDSIMCGRKVNLRFMIIQSIENVISSAFSVLPYGMLLTVMFQHFGVTLMMRLTCVLARRLMLLTMDLLLACDMKK